MDDREFERELERLFKADLSAGTEEFRDVLLARCLEVLGDDADDGLAELEDADLELLAAAGNSDSVDGRVFRR